jgi:N-acyl-D-aspartate/D-glutamate deacylase
VIDIASPGSRCSIDLTYTPAAPTERYVIHAGRLVDMKRRRARKHDIVIEGAYIASVAPHSDAAHANIRVIDAGTRTVMPGLIEYHSHMQKDLGEAHERAALAFGITTVRSPGSTPYEGVEDKEAVDAGVRIGPRVVAAGYLMEWQRVYYKMAVAVANSTHLEMELQRARVLGHDVLKAYVRMPDLAGQAHRRVRARERDTDFVARGVSGGAVGAGRHRAHDRDQPARFFTQGGHAQPQLRRRGAALGKVGDDLHAHAGVRRCDYGTHGGGRHRTAA